MGEIVKKNDAPAIISRMQEQFAKVLPKIITPERYCRVVLSAVNKNPALAEAIADQRNQASVLSAFMRCAEMGLEPDGRRATINCYRKKQGGYDVTLIPMYQGLSELAMRSGLISNIHADKLCENDFFDWDTGNIKHKIDFRKPRGKAYAYYVVVTFKDGSNKTETMSKDEIEEIMKRSSAYQASAKYGKDCPWTTDFDEMAKKTVFRRCSKWLPLSPELRSAVEADDDDYSAINTEVAHAANDQFFQAVSVSAENEITETVDAEVTESPADETVVAENLFDGDAK